MGVLKLTGKDLLLTPDYGADYGDIPIFQKQEASRDDIKYKPSRALGQCACFSFSSFWTGCEQEQQLHPQEKPLFLFG